jgi:hypothetical protein
MVLGKNARGEVPSLIFTSLLLVEWISGYVVAGTNGRNVYVSGGRAEEVGTCTPIDPPGRRIMGRDRDAPRYWTDWGCYVARAALGLNALMTWWQ